MLDNFVILQKEAISIFGQFKGFSKKPMAKIGYLALRKKGREKIRIGKVAKSCHQVTWVQKSVNLISKSLNVNS